MQLQRICHHEYKLYDCLKHVEFASFSYQTLSKRFKEYSKKIPKKMAPTCRVCIPRPTDVISSFTASASCWFTESQNPGTKAFVGLFQKIPLLWWGKTPLCSDYYYQYRSVCAINYQYLSLVTNYQHHSVDLSSVNRSALACQGFVLIWPNASWYEIYTFRISRDHTIKAPKAPQALKQFWNNRSV